MKISETIGIDISKLDFDIHIHSNQMYRCFDNNKEGFKKMVKWTYRNSPFLKEETL